MIKHELIIFADYHQFYIQDEEAEGDLSNAWTSKAEEMFIAIAKGTIGIGTFSNNNVNVTIEIYEQNQDIVEENYIDWDKINEAGIVLNSKILVVAGCTDYFPEAQRFMLGKGKFLVRIYYKAEPERYLLKIVPAKTKRKPIVIK